MVVYVLLCLFVTILYFIIQWYLRLVFNGQAMPDSLNQNTPSRTVSVVIPCRNEKNSIETRIQDILHVTYPKDLLEILVVDDFSEDGTANVVQDFVGKTPKSNIKLLSLSDVSTNDDLPHKKLAIEYAIRNAVGELILLTDADCRNKPSWLSTMVQSIENYDLQ